ncbi:MAG: hypothetical protein RL660_3061 [Bacteroidota bacterium]|jgi:hypothetical protein
MNEHININEIIELVRQQEPLRKDVLKALTECRGGQWRGNAYFQFVDSANANQVGAEWQFEENIVVEHPEKGTIIIDVLKNNKIGGLEFYELIGKKSLKTKAKFHILDSFNISGRGIVLVGEILAGTIKVENFLVLKLGQDEVKLKIKGVDFLDKVTEKVAQIGLTFFYDNIEQKANLENIKIEKQIALISEN